MAITALCSMLKPATERDPSHCQFSAQPNHLVSINTCVLQSTRCSNKFCGTLSIWNFHQNVSLVYVVNGFYFFFSVPESPQKLKITVKTDSSVIISWLPPPQRNFVPITGYTLHIRHKHDAAEEISTDQVQIEASNSNLHYIAEGLKPSVYYQFWVVANSLLGQGNASIIQGYRVARSKHNIGTNT